MKLCCFRPLFVPLIGVSLEDGLYCIRGTGGMSILHR